MRWWSFTDAREVNARKNRFSVASVKVPDMSMRTGSKRWVVSMWEAKSLRKLSVSGTSNSSSSLVSMPGMSVMSISSELTLFIVSSDMERELEDEREVGMVSVGLFLEFFIALSCN